MKETFEEGIRGIQAAFNEQNNAIKEAMASQKNALENALNEQQQAIVRKLQETPGQLQAISELSKVLDKLNETMSNPNISGIRGFIGSDHDSTGETPVKKACSVI